MRESELANIAAVAESAATTRWREGPKTAKAMSGRRNCVEPGDHRRAGDAGVAENLRNGSSKLASGRQPRPEEPRALIGRRPPSILNDIRRCPLSSSDGRSAQRLAALHLVSEGPVRGVPYAHASVEGRVAQ
jgi:hypothetical protein